MTSGSTVGGELAARRFDLAVVGASFGAVEALGRLVPAQPPDSALPIAIVLHVPAGRENLLPRLLAARSRVRVCEAGDGESLVPGSVYFAPPGAHLRVTAAGVFAVSFDPPLRYSRPSIDVLFRSASEAYGAGVLGIVLTGANSDGAEGLRLIKERGGVAVVQSPDEAPAPEMPRAAIRLARPDLVLTLDGIASYVRSVSRGS